MPPATPRPQPPVDVGAGPRGDRQMPRVVGMVIRRPRRAAAAGLFAAVLMGAVLLLMPAGLSPGGYVAQDTEATRADALLAQRFGAGLPDLVLRVRSTAHADDPVVADAGLRLVEDLAHRPGVQHVFSYWSEQDPRLLSRDRRSTLVTVDLAGSEAQAVETARMLVPQLSGRKGPLTLSATGASWTSVQVSQLSQSDLIRAELFGAPLVVLVLLLVFGSVAGALLPALVGGLAIAGTLAALRLIAPHYPISVFAPNLAVALGFGLAVDYALLVVTRHRDELATGASVRVAATTTMRATGRAVFYSAATILTCLAALLLFPLPFLRSLALAGMLVVALSAAATLLLLPPALLLLGERLRRPASPPHPYRKGWARLRPTAPWTRLARIATRRPALSASCAAGVLLCLLLPFAHIKFGPADARVLPADAEAHAVSRQISTEFDVPWNRTLQVLLPHTDAIDREQQVHAYARRVSALPHVRMVDGPTGTYRSGKQHSSPGPSAAFYTAPGATWLAVVAAEPPTQDATLIDRLRALPAPGTHLVTGEPARQADTETALAERLPLAAGCVTAAVGLLLFLLTGSLVLPLKTIIVGLLSLGATFGALVTVFQDGHFLTLIGGGPPTGELILPVPLLMFCVAFGLGIDYEVFLLARILEEHHHGRPLHDAVVTGVAATSRIITTAALLVALALLPLITSQLTILKMLGLGLALAVLVDATLVRGVLVPAVMCLLGRANWWAPGPLTRWHQRHPARVHLPPPASVPATRGHDRHETASEDTAMR
ncbi:MMPL family transporter (plasmid) [Streptomyces sp. CA-294286]|uniref:MMPL family transporter n=1 Tax=Streptomyces sp. CA-294286 TaxID=3240070 RepID=UPI003D94FC7D